MTAEHPVPMVDAHCHVFKKDMPLRDNPRHAPEYDFTVEALMKVLDDNGVGFAVIAAASPWADYNDYVLDSVAARPRLRGTVILEPTVERMVMRDMADSGIVGMRLHMIGLADMPDISTFAWRRTFRRIADLNWHVHVHADCRDLPMILPQLEATGVRIVVDHLGRPDPAEGFESEGFLALLAAIERGNTWVKASGPHRLGYPHAAETLRQLVSRAGPERLVWASDCPFVGQEDTTYESTITWFLDAVPDPEARRRILGANALELYFS